MKPKVEFIIALTEHRYLGYIFLPYLIKRNKQFYTIISHLKPQELNEFEDYSFQPWEEELVLLADKYSDVRLTRKFSRTQKVTDFFKELDKADFQKQVLPYIEKTMFRMAEILMVNPVRLISKRVKYANVYDEDEIMTTPLFAHPVFHFKRTETGTHYSLKIFFDEHEILLKDHSVKIIASNPCMLVYEHKLIVFARLNAKKLLPFLGKEEVVIPKSLEESYYQGFVLKAISNFDVHAEGFTILSEEKEKTAWLSLENNLKGEPAFALRFGYGNAHFLPGSKRKTTVNLTKSGDNYFFKKTIRDDLWETETEKFLVSLGLEENNGWYYPKTMLLQASGDELYAMLNWVDKNRKELASKNIVFVQDKLEKQYFTGEQQLKVKTKARGDWFDVHITVRFGDFEIPFIKLKKYILNGNREFELPNGEIAVLPEEWLTRYQGLIPFAHMNNGHLQFGKYHYVLLQERLKGISSSVAAQIKALEFDPNFVVDIPEKLKATLRSYQKTGFYWMYQLHKNGLCGCLADDMGLGKTLQTLTLLLKLKRQQLPVTIVDPFASDSQLNLFDNKNNEEYRQQASLIVLPTSLVHNWENEIRKFAPSLKTYKYVGAVRQKSVEIAKIAGFYDIILTTYGTLRNDIEMLAGAFFFYVILDESQYIKNPSSKTYKAVLKLKSEHRLVLTGTPIENSLSDLWSQMNFLNPGLLGSLAFFRRHFITPIEKGGDLSAQERLQSMIKPFVLRRRKEEVASDLPSLMEKVHYCEMTPEQQKLYEKEKSTIRNAILEHIENNGIKKSSLIVLQGLTKLRQLANHPQLIDSEDTSGSGKMNEVFEMLHNLMEQNNKVLLFSSFVSHLELLKHKIEEAGWKFSWLTGKTVQRDEVIRQFQQDADNRIFLISLKAGGVGLNLTSADYVFILDPWWNPAAENQAVSRAHRIGQDKHVFVYRFITTGTIEEKIEQLKEHKSALADQFIHSNNPFQKINKDELVALFR